MKHEIKICKNKNKRTYRAKFYVDSKNLGCSYCTLWDNQLEMGTGRICDECLRFFDNEMMSERGVFITPVKTWKSGESE